MTTLSLLYPQPNPKDNGISMPRTPSVMVALIICATILGLALFGVMGVLLYYGKDAGIFMTLVNAFLTAAVYAKVRDVDQKATRVEQQTNGATTRLMDHALGPQPSKD